MALMILLQTHQRPVKNTARVQWSYHKKLGFVDSLVSIRVEHIERNSETSFRLCNKIHYRKRAALRSTNERYDDTNIFVSSDIFNQICIFSRESREHIYIHVYTPECGCSRYTSRTKIQNKVQKSTRYESST